MKIVIDKPCSTDADIYIYAVDADIEVTADLVTTADKIDLIGKNLTVKANITALTGDVTLLGREDTTINPTTSSTKARKVNVGKATISPFYASGIHISPSLKDKVTFLDK